MSTPIYPVPGTVLSNKIYKLFKDQKDNYYLKEHLPKFEIPKKIYGTYKTKPKRFLKKFGRRSKSLGLMLIGEKGTGKTLLSELIANNAINDGMAVIYITDIRLDEKVTELIGMLHNVIVIFDEFGKSISYEKQGRMLSLFSANNGNKKFFIIAENNINLINRFLVDRPTRMWYRMNFNKLDEVTRDEYIADFPVDPEFKRRLLIDYKKAPFFSFDHLQAIIEEHLEFPEESYDDITSVMNISILGTEIEYVLYKIENIDDDTLDYKLNEKPSVKPNNVNDGRVWFNADEFKKPEKDENKEEQTENTQQPNLLGPNTRYNTVRFILVPDEIISYTDEEIIYLTDNKYKCYFKLKTEEDPKWKA